MVVSPSRLAYQNAQYGIRANVILPGLITRDGRSIPRPRIQKSRAEGRRGPARTRKCRCAEDGHRLGRRQRRAVPGFRRSQLHHRRPRCRSTARQRTAGASNQKRRRNLLMAPRRTDLNGRGGWRGFRRCRGGVRALPACTCCIAFAGLALRHGFMKRAAVSGGTWYWNAYPGARCDVRKHAVIPSHSPKSWTAMGLVGKVRAAARDPSYAPTMSPTVRSPPATSRFDTRVTAATSTRSRNLAHRNRPRRPCHRAFCIMAVGALSAANRRPSEDARIHGPIYHTGEWLIRVDFNRASRRRDRYGFLGSQSIPIIAQQASALTVSSAPPPIPCRPGTKS